MQPLDPLTIPLAGRRLLEASAGTGKTYTLALLYLRLVLERRLGVDRILVMTFTRAATGELRDRIRVRLRQALQLLDGRDPDPDPQLTELLARVEPGEARQLLTDSLTQMDEATISTIHGFCQRVLQEHAFESGAPFEARFIECEHDLRRQVSEDFWRTRFYPAPEEEAAWAAATWGDPATLLERLGPASSALEVELLPAEDPAALAALRPLLTERFAAVRQAWARTRTEVVAVLLDSGNRLKRDGKTYRLADQVPELVGAMDSLAAGEGPPPVLPAGIDRLAAPVMATLLKKTGTDPEHPFFHLFADFHDTFIRLRALQEAGLLHEARRFLLDTLDRRKREQGLLTFDDLLTRLDQALARPDSGPRLAARIFERYPAAMVDEFQDTDPLQYRLFNRIYHRDDAALFLIGDPKQAIYSFRGADIFTYIRARQETPATHRYTMTTNHRATAAMVGAVNRLFSLRPDAFIFTEGIVFQPVQAAAGAGPPLVVDGLEVTPFTALLLAADEDGGKGMSKKDAAPLAVARCASEIVRLLAAADRGRATIDQRPLSAGDIAVLVRTNREAEAIQAGLRARGLASVTLVQASVFASTEAGQLARVLAALLDPADSGAVRTCLATDLFGLDATALHALRADEPGWAARLDQLTAYQHLWRDQGFLSMFQRLLADQQVTRRLTGRPGGERALTNFLHLAELLQDSAAAHHGATALLRWFEQQRQRPDPNSGDQLIRLENDGALVRIVTIHRAKGLEFPVVFLPFLWSVRQPRQVYPLRFHDPESHRPVLDLGSGREDHVRLARTEQLAEDLRLLYVAVTRAKCCCLFSWGRVSGMDAGGLAHLLGHGGLPPTDAALAAGLEQLNVDGPVLTLRPPAEDDAGLRVAPPISGPPLRPRVFRGRIDAGWSLTSYSRLIADAPAERERDDEEGDSPAAPVAAADFADIHTFPRGPAVGTCLHTLLERLDFQRPLAAQRPLVVDALNRAGIDDRWLTATVAWMDGLLQVGLPGSCRLADITGRDRINELAFLFPLEQLSRRHLNTVLADHGHRPLPTSEGRLQGLMKGFVDLVFRHRGRFYLVDYKSNHLGPDLGAYTPEALAACMDEHHYHLQSLIYTLAVHRHLQARMAGYSYETHFGGVYYLFLRALRPDHPEGTGVFAARPAPGLIDALDRCCRGLEAS